MIPGFRVAQLPRWLAGIFVALLPAAQAHRLDELLQRSFLSVEPSAIGIDVVLTPGAAIAEEVIGLIDSSSEATRLRDRSRATRTWPMHTFSRPRRPPSITLMTTRTPQPRRAPRALPALVLLTSTILGTTLVAQDNRPERGREGERGGGFMRMNPLFAALDTNGDGVIDETEIQNAPAALKKLDKNNDGKLTEEEVRPAFGRGPDGPGRPGGPDGRGGPGGRGGPMAGNVDEIVNRMLQFDKDGDGKLSKDELPERMQRMMERGDTNKDGFLSRDELMVIARAQAEMGRRGDGPRDRGRPHDDERK